MTKKVKKSSGKTSTNKSHPKDSGLTESDYDEVDRFHSKKDQILLEDDDQDAINSDEADYDPDTILDIPEEEEDDDWEEDEKEEYDDDELFANDYYEEEDKDNKWGKKRKDYYSADTNVDKEEAAEGERLYKKKLSSLNLQDFGVDEDVLKSSTGSKKVIVKSVTFDSEPEDNMVKCNEAEDGPSVDQVEHELGAALAEVKQVLQPFIDRISKGDLPRSEGLSFLQTKYNLLLHYCINAVYYVKSRASGKSLPDDHPVIERLIKYRMLIEKTKPLEAKLKHQIDNLLRAAAATNNNELSSTSQDDNLRPHIELINDDAEKEDGIAHDAVDGAQKYRPPKILQTEMFDERKAGKNRPSRIQEELSREEMLDEEAPEEEGLDPVVRVGNAHRNGAAGIANTLEDAEEDNFVRFSLSKKEKRKLAEQSKIIDGLDDLNDMFDEFERRRPAKKVDDDDHDGDDGTAKVAMKSQSKLQKHNPRESESEIESDSDDYYDQVKAQKQAKKSAQPSSEPKKVRFRDIVDQEVGQSRPASKTILNNRGLTPSRPKDTKNPRLKQRKRFEKATKRLGSFRAVHRTNQGPYKGEMTGIRKDITRSHKF